MSPKLPKGIGVGISVAKKKIQKLLFLTEILGEFDGSLRSDNS